MKNMFSTDEFVREFSEFSRMNQKDIRYMLKSLGSFIEVCIEEQVSFKTNVVELYYSSMKSRKTKLFGELPPSRKVKVRLANKYRMAQKGQNKVMKTVLEKTEIENSQPLTDLE